MPVTTLPHLSKDKNSADSIVEPMIASAQPDYQFLANTAAKEGQQADAEFFLNKLPEKKRNYNAVIISAVENGHQAIADYFNTKAFSQLDAALSQTARQPSSLSITPTFNSVRKRTSKKSISTTSTAILPPSYFGQQKHRVNNRYFAKNATVQEKLAQLTLKIDAWQETTATVQPLNESDTLIDEPRTVSRIG